MGLPLNHLKYKKFANEAKKSKLTDGHLNDLLDEFTLLSEEDRQKYSPGAGLFKLRMATSEGRGKRAGSRSILVFREND